MSTDTEDRDPPPKGPCPVCGKEQGDWLMAHRSDLPGLLGILRGERGEAWRIFITIAVCVIVVLLLTGAEQALTH